MAAVRVPAVATGIDEGVSGGARARTSALRPATSFSSAFLLSSATTASSAWHACSIFSANTSSSSPGTRPWAERGQRQSGGGGWAVHAGRQAALPAAVPID